MKNLIKDTKNFVKRNKKELLLVGIGVFVGSFFTRGVYHDKKAFVVTKSMNVISTRDANHMAAVFGESLLELARIPSFGNSLTKTNGVTFRMYKSPFGNWNVDAFLTKKL